MRRNATRSPVSKGDEKTCYVDLVSMRVSAQALCRDAYRAHLFPDDVGAGFEASAQRALREKKCTTVIPYRCTLALGL